MPDAEILTYTAHTGRLGELGTDKLIILRHRGHGTGGGPVEDSSTIHFSDRYEQMGGFGVDGNPESVRAYLPESEYGAWLDLLRHEDPMYLHWTESEPPGETDAEGIIHLSTGPEPPGEGPVDLSP